MKGNFIAFFVLLFVLFLGWTEAAPNPSCKTCGPKKDVITVPPAAARQLPPAPSPSCVNGPPCDAPPAPNSGVIPGQGAIVHRPRFPYGEQKIRGVNLGGWFVLEPWVNPSLFDQTGNGLIVDEWTYGYYQDRGVTQPIIERHWDTWITEDDFAAMARAGLNHVRIPMPYWSVPTANTSTMPFLTGSWPRLLRAVSWASKYDISVIIDIHCAPGSQNGYDNSGRRVDIPQWHTAPENVDHTRQAFAVLLNEFGNFEKWGGTVGAIEALNEPAAFHPDVLPVANQYWYDTYGILTDLRIARGTESEDGTVDPNEIKLVISDGFIGVRNYTGFLVPPHAEGVMMDTHLYQIFDPDLIPVPQQAHIAIACAIGAGTAASTLGGLWTFVGEWSAPPTDCTPWLNGRFVGSDWVTAVPGRSCDGMTGAWQTFSDDFRNFLAQYFEAQVMAYEQTQGWIYWTWKTETADEWSYSKGIEGGWIPADISDMSLRRFPNICS